MTNNAAPMQPERPDTTGDVQQVDEAIRKLEAAAASYRDKDEGYVELIGVSTLLATVVAALNMWFQTNLDQLGGWVPFCLATAFLSGLATLYSWKLKREEPRTHKERCLKSRYRLDELRRKLGAPKLTPRSHTLLQKEFISIKEEADNYLLPARKGYTRLLGFGWIAFVLVVYLGWIGWALHNHIKH